MKKFLFFLLFFAFIPLSFAQDNIQNVLKIQSYTFDQEKQVFVLQQYWSAVVYKKDIILTNAHVILDEETQKPIWNYRVCKTTDFKKSPDCTLTAQLLYYDVKNDLAALKISQQSQSVTLSQKDLKITDGVKVLGYPGNGGSTITYTEWKVSWYEDDLYKVDANIDAGNSGGWVFDQNDHLVWMSVSVRVWYSTLGYIIPLETIKKFYDKKTKNIVEVKQVSDRKFSQFVNTQKVIAAGKIFSNPFFEIKDYKKYKLSFHEYLINQKNEYFVTSFYDSSKSTSFYVYNQHTSGNTWSLLDNIYHENTKSERSEEWFEKITGKKQKIQWKNGYIFYSYYDDGSVYAQVAYEQTVNDYLIFSIYSENWEKDTSFLNAMSLATKWVIIKNIPVKKKDTIVSTWMQFSSWDSFVLVKNLYETTVISTQKIGIEIYEDIFTQDEVDSKIDLKSLSESMLKSLQEKTYLMRFVYKKTTSWTPYTFLVAKNDEIKNGEKIIWVEKYFAIAYFYHKTPENTYIAQRVLFLFSKKSDLESIERFVEKISVKWFSPIEIWNMKEWYDLVETPDFVIQ